MRAIRFLPLVFLVGVDGFAMFAPYLVLVLSLAYVARRLRPDEGEPIAIPVDNARPRRSA